MFEQAVGEKKGRSKLTRSTSEIGRWGLKQHGHGPSGCYRVSFLDPPKRLSHEYLRRLDEEKDLDFEPEFIEVGASSTGSSSPSPESSRVYRNLYLPADPANP